MESKFFGEIQNSVPNYLKIFTNKSLDILEQVHAILKRKGMTQKELAKKLGKSESEVSKWLSGGHNITLKTISKMEDALGEEIIIVSEKAFDRLELLSLDNSIERIHAYRIEKGHRHDSELYSPHDSKIMLSKYKPLVQ